MRSAFLKRSDAKHPFVQHEARREGPSFLVRSDEANGQRPLSAATRGVFVGHGAVVVQSAECAVCRGAVRGGGTQSSVKRAGAGGNAAAMGKGMLASSSVLMVGSLGHSGHVAT